MKRKFFGRKESIFLLIGVFFVLLVLNSSVMITGNVVENQEVYKMDYILLEFNIVDGEFVLVNRNLEKGNFPEIKHGTSEEYRVFLYDKEDSLIYSSYINAPGVLFTDGDSEDGWGGGFIEVDDVNFFVIVPETKNSDKLEVYKGETKLLEEDVHDVGAKSCRLE